MDEGSTVRRSMLELPRGGSWRELNIQPQARRSAATAAKRLAPTAPDALQGLLRDDGNLQLVGKSLDVTQQRQQQAGPALLPQRFVKGPAAHPQRVGQAAGQGRHTPAAAQKLWIGHSAQSFLANVGEPGALSARDVPRVQWRAAHFDSLDADHQHWRRQRRG